MQSKSSISSKDTLYALLSKHDGLTASQLSEELFLSRQMVHRHLKTLIAEGRVSKKGTPPKVFYFIKKEAEDMPENEFTPDPKTARILEEHFLMISPSGERVSGVAGFSRWCRERNYDPRKKAAEYVKLFEKYEKMRIGGFLDGSEKLKSSFKQVCLDKLFYIDFYAWEIFGKTKLGQLLLYSKQSQNRKLIAELSLTVKEDILKLIKKERIDAVGFIPPTVKREVQFMKVLEKTLKLSLPTIKLVKIQSEITVPQKTLTKLRDRIENADATIALQETRHFKNILLIDDSVGSGATLNQTACKIKRAEISEKVVGLSLTSSAKGFDVISEV